jgi:hypothetical protein
MELLSSGKGAKGICQGREIRNKYKGKEIQKFVPKRLAIQVLVCYDRFE